MFTQIVLVLVVLAGLLGAGSAACAARRSRARYRRAIGLWQAAAPAGRLSAMQSLLATEGASGPAWYLCGCAALREYRSKQAARAFGMAHHADCDLETAALLTFACLKASEGESSDIIEQIVVTWQEMNQPDVLRTRADRLMLEPLSEDDPPERLSPLGRLAWSVVGPPLRAKLLDAAADPRYAALWSSTVGGAKG